MGKKQQKKLDEMTLSELESKLEELKSEKEEVSTQRVDVWKLGHAYVIRTVTMIDVGKLVKVTDKELVLEQACWIAETDRWMSFLKDGKIKESEPFPAGEVIIGRGAIIDACEWKNSLDIPQK